jgi:penicillin-binding protein 1C
VNLRPAARAARIVGAAALILFLLCNVVVASGTLIDRSRFAHPDDSVTVTDRSERVLRLSRVEGADRRWVRLSEISPNFIAAVIAAEDKNFYAHRGIDWFALMRAAASDLLPWGRRQGASTLTQQLVKRVYPRQGFWSKPLEMLRAMALERVLSKDEILEQYLNRLPFGDGIEGVERASESYFGHHALTLSVAEAALLAGVPQAPSVTEPRRHLARALARRGYVLDRMVQRGSIDRATWEIARKEQPTIAAESARPWKAPRFVDHVLGLARRHEITREGTIVRTSLDLALQERAETIVQAAVSHVGGRGARNGAVVVVANATGEVLAYVGAARGSAGDAGGALDLLRARRQPGSTLKPFVYELFFERGNTPATVLDDVSVALRGARGSTFEARDYDGHERGPVRARVALSASLNLAALDAAGRVGSERVVARLRALGITASDNAAQYGAAVVLGGADVTALELARAYVTLARGGTSLPLAWTPTEARPGTRVMGSPEAALTWDILADSTARSDAFGADLRDLCPHTTFSLKTGTSSNWRDAWAAVSTRRVTVVVWIGDPAGSPMRSVSGFEASAPAAVRIAAEAERMVERIDVSVLPEVQLVEGAVCAHSGLRAGPRCPRIVSERFAREHVPQDTCEAHDAEGRFLLNERYAAWFARQHPAGMSMGATTHTGVATSVEVPVVNEPRAGARWILDPHREPPVVSLRATPGDVHWEVDGVTIENNRWTATPGTHRIVAIHGTLRSTATVIEVRMGH